MSDESRTIEIELSLGQISDQLSRWSYDDLLELIKEIDEKKGEWDFVAQLKPWVDGQHRQMIQEETEEKAEREEKCQRSAEYPDIWVHVSPHRGCILR